VIFDLDGTREGARQRALPQTEDLPPARRRLDDVCAPGYTGRKRLRQFSARRPTMSFFLKKGRGNRCKTQGESDRDENEHYQQRYSPAWMATGGRPHPAISYFDGKEKEPIQLKPGQMMLDSGGQDLPE
jgi:hypothetical protein